MQGQLQGDESSRSRSASGFLTTAGQGFATFSAEYRVFQVLPSEMWPFTLDPDRFSDPDKRGRIGGWRLETESNAGDPGRADTDVEGWTRSPDDPNVQARLAHLREKNGLQGLEIVHFSEVERATQLFLRDGFVAVSDVLSAEQLERMQAATAKRNAEILAERPDGIRYSYSSHTNLHRQEWADLIDLETTTPILKSIFSGSGDYWCWGAGGDFSLPGTYEYQGLHRDIGPGSFVDPSGKIQIWDLPPFSVTLNFPMVDFTGDVGPIRQIPGVCMGRNKSRKFDIYTASPRYLRHVGCTY